MLLQELRDEAFRRGLWSSTNPRLPGVEASFELVRDMPYQRARDRQPLTTIREWRGTCSGKHYLLKEVFAELGRSATLMACTQYISPTLARALPDEIGSLFDDGPVPDVHNYLVLETPARGMIVDATWPRGSEKLGLHVNEEFVWGRDMRLACTPIEHFRVPEDVDPQQYKKSLLETRFRPDELDRRERFFKAVAG